MQQRNRSPNEDVLLLQRKPRLSVWQSLAFRGLLVLAMLGIALLGHWLDRGGLRDTVDGQVSFVDILYFTTVTITTVGYGDIVPVTDRARMFDTFVVTPIRVFVWLIFLGTAYTFVLRHSWERMKSKMAFAGLRGHNIVCGFGHGGEAAVRELIRQGTDPSSILVIDPNQQRIDLATELGATGLVGDATLRPTLEAAAVTRCAAILVSPGRDDTAALIVLSARQVNPEVPISVSVRAVDNEELLHQAGATIVINPVTFGGHLLARGASNRDAVAYLQDLVSANGHVFLRERVASASEIGKPLHTLDHMVGLRILRGGTIIDAVDDHDVVVVANDRLLEIVSADRVGR